MTEKNQGTNAIISIDKSHSRYLDPGGEKWLGGNGKIILILLMEKLRTSYYLWNPMKNGIFSISNDAGFFPSTGSGNLLIQTALKWLLAPKSMLVGICHPPPPPKKKTPWGALKPDPLPPHPCFFVRTTVIRSRFFRFLVGFIHPLHSRLSKWWTDSFNDLGHSTSWWL